MSLSVEPGRSPRSAVAGAGPTQRRPPVLGGLLPIRPSRVPADLLAARTRRRLAPYERAARADARAGVEPDGAAETLSRG